MPTTLPLIEAKLLPPRARPGLVVRDRLLDEIDGHSSAALTLVDAPTGFGKTTLVQSWCARTDTAVAWVTLDVADNDPARLWTYLATSLDRVRPGLGRPALASLRSPGPAPEIAVDELLNGMNAYGDPLAIVIDDLHVLTDEACLRSLLHLVEHLSPQTRVVATTRADPPLPLGRLRAHRALGEIRARELAFTSDEARNLLVGSEGIALDEEDVELLVERTEGWPAGLYLASLWLRELDDPRAGVRAFHGDHRHVADYLTGEVLDTLDGESRQFLLETSAFGTFSAAMCDEILDRSDSAERLEMLERANVFLIPLDANGGWYRYHHLFGELLQLELATAEPDAPRRLHADACSWCRDHDLLDDALQHAAATQDRGLVAELLSSAHRTLLVSGRPATLLRWCAWLDEEDLVLRPELSLATAFAAGLGGSPSDVRHRYVALAGRSRYARSEAWLPYHEAFFGIVRATWVEDDIEETIALGFDVLDMARQVPEAAVPALASLAFVSYLAGRLDDARALVHEALDRPQAPATPVAFVVALSTLSHLETDSGCPETGEERARVALATAQRAGVDHMASGGAAHVALASALAAQGRLREAEPEAVEGERLRRQTEPEAAHLHALLVLAAIRARRGRLDHAAADLARVRSELETFTDAGRLPALATQAENLLEKARATASLVSETPSEAELSVLRLLATDFSQREIGARLYISLNTVKTHTRALYRKLGATSREEAVERAAALGLLESSESPG